MFDQISDREHEFKMMLEDELENLIHWLKTGELSPDECLDSMDDLVSLYKKRAN